MSFEIIFVFILLAVSLFLFSTNYVSFDIAALIIMVSLLVTGILEPEEGLAGFSNPATLTVATMFVLSESLRRTGIMDKVGDYFSKKNSTVSVDWDFSNAALCQYLLCIYQ